MVDVASPEARAAACFCRERFADAVKRIGLCSNAGRMTVGAALAAFGTSLPESKVT
ncbi:hypothetical protein ACIQMV_36000 [Streptomyces sp. NPDC091412]|uniref:hypothetical protein n=1 Tax=Streptomyces sp. NPDC091412 TaxID=3366002 RepID=UPI00380B46B7